MKSVKQEIQQTVTFENFQNSNSWVRRFFRLFLEGSYGFENYPNYENLKLRYNQKKSKTQKMKVLRSFIIENFSKFGAIEFNCSRGYFQKVIVQTFSKNELEEINKILIEELIEEFFDVEEIEKIPEDLHF